MNQAETALKVALNT